MSMKFQRHLTNIILTLSNGRITESNQIHRSVLKIKNKFGSDLNSFAFPQIKAPEVQKTHKRERR